jgi:iron transport multicopper oxidase
VYDSDKELPEPKLLDEFNAYDDIQLVPMDEMPRLPQADRTITLDVIMDNLGDGANYAFFNNITYKHPTVPSLYTALTAGDMAANPLVYGSHTNAHVLEKGEIVDIVVNNLDPGRHPFHLHGHNFQVVYRSEEEAGTWQDAGVKEEDLPETPMRRDTVLIRPNGNMVLRFKADNPGGFSDPSLSTRPHGM